MATATAITNTQDIPDATLCEIGITPAMFFTVNLTSLVSEVVTIVVSIAIKGYYFTSGYQRSTGTRCTCGMRVAPVRADVKRKREKFPPRKILPLSLDNARAGE